jgi:hypothetical protein
MIPQEYFDKVKKHYLGNEVKTWTWFKTTHPAFGMMSPLAAIQLGQQRKVMKLIDNELVHR